MAQNAPAVFVSYSSEDSDFALRLSGDLKAAGASVWLDKFDIVPGQRWDRAVEDALTNCALMLVVLSPDSVGSNNVMDEVSHALDAQKTVIPVLYRECVIPFRLRRVQYVDFRGDYDTAVRLLKTLVIGAGVLLPERFRRGEALGLHPDEREADTKEFNAKPHFRGGDAETVRKVDESVWKLSAVELPRKAAKQRPELLGPLAPEVQSAAGKRAESVPQALSSNSKPARKIVRPWDLRDVWNAYGVMRIDWQVNCLRLIEQEDEYTGEGRLARDALRTYIRGLERERANRDVHDLWRRDSSTGRIDAQLAEARKMLRDMDEVSADAIDYLDEQLKGFPDHLRRLAVELLMKDDRNADGKINQFIIDNARSRYYAMPEGSAGKAKALENINELAKKLGFD